MDAAIRILAAVGPLDSAALAAAISRYQRYRHRRSFTVESLAEAMVMSEATQDEQGRWHAPPGTPDLGRYRAIINAGGGRDLTRQDMITVLIAAGYTPSSASGVLTDTHPLFTRTGPNRYRNDGFCPRSARAPWG